MKWIVRIVLLSVIGIVGYAGYETYRGGYLSLPEIENGAYPISFRSGLRGIVYDVDVEDDRYADSPKIFRRLATANPDRQYLGIPMDVSPWFEDAWAECRPPNQEVIEYFENSMPEDMKVKLIGARFDAFCFIKSDESNIIRGAIYSVPKNN